MTDAPLTCDVCNGESGGTFVGVASVPGAPVSIAWCNQCLTRNCAPSWIFDHDFIFVAGGDATRLAEWALARETWADGRYLSFTEYVTRISPADVQRELTGDDEVMRATPRQEE